MKNKKRKLTKKEKEQQQSEQEIDIVEKVQSLHDILMPDALSEEMDTIYLGPNKYLRSFVITVYPRETYVGWLDDVYSVGEIDLSVITENVPDHVVIKKLTELVVKATTEHNLHTKAGNIQHLPQLEEMVRDLERERAAIQTNRDRMFFTTLLITVRAKSLHELDDKCQRLDSLMARKSAHIRSLTTRQIEGFKNTLPINMPPLKGYDRNITTGGLATMFPVSNPELTHENGVYLGDNLFTGAPVFLNSFIGPPHLSNQHLTIFGTSGSGKSYALKLMLARSYAIGRRIAIIDPEGEYQKLVSDMLDGRYINIKQGESAGINLFDIEPDLDESGTRQSVNIYEKIAEIRNLCGAVTWNFMGRALNGLEAIAIEESVQQIYKERGINKNVESLYIESDMEESEEGEFFIGKIKKRMPTLTDFHNILKEKKNAEELATIFQPFLRGGSMGMFDCESTLQPDDKIIAFNMFEIEDEFTKFYANFVLLSWIWQKFVQTDKDVQKVVACDETWMFIKYPESAKFLESLARRGRKHNVSLIVASQFIDEFLSSEEGKSVINSCASSILMRQSSASTEQTVKHFHLSSGTRESLQSFTTGECIISLGGAVSAVRIKSFPYEHPYMTGNFGN